MKSGSVQVRLLAGVPVIVGLCLMTGCVNAKRDKYLREQYGANAPTLPQETPPPTVIVVTNITYRPSPPPAAPGHAELKEQPSMTTPYTVKAGESISSIASKYGKRWQDVLAVNPDLTSKSVLRVGQTIQLPNPVDLAHPKPVHKHANKSGTKKAASAGTKPEHADATSTGEATYTVKKGDSVAVIAAAHHVKRDNLMKANNLTTKSVLKVGQKLVIPVKGDSVAPVSEAAPADVNKSAPEVAPPATVEPTAVPAPDAGAVPPPPPPEAGSPSASVAPSATGAGGAPAAAAAPATSQEPKTYVVKEGEDVYAVAIRWGVSPSELKALNNLSSADLQPGQILKIPVVAASAP